MIGTLLTILLGLIASEIDQFISDRNIKKLTSSSSEKSETHDHKISAIVQIDSDTVARIESTLKQAMSASNMPHLRIIDDDDKMIIVNEETLVSSPVDASNNASVIEIFFEKKDKYEGLENPVFDLSSEEKISKHVKFAA